jgi:formate dehydrogenase iron-sulfur subunit
MTLEEAQRVAREAETEGLHTYGLSEVGGTSWIYISDVPFSEFGLQDYDSMTQNAFEEGMLIRFAGIGIFIGGALIAAAKLYAERRETIAKQKSEGGS